MVDENPALDLGKIIVKAKQVVPFTDDEMKAILSAAIARIETRKTKDERERSKQAYALILLMRRTGLRISDATMLKLDSLKTDSKKTRISLRTQKMNTQVKVLVTDTVTEALTSFEAATKTHYFWDGARL